MEISYDHLIDLAETTAALDGVPVQGRPMGKPALDISTLTAEAKLGLSDDLWRSFAPEDLALDAELPAELDRRLGRGDSEGPVGVTREDVLTI